MSQASRQLRSIRVRKSMRARLRAMLRAALLAELGLAGSLFSGACLYAQDTNNSTTKNLVTNAVEDAATGAYNNLSTGVLNFNGPSGAAQWSSNDFTINNDGQVNLVRADLGIIGDVTNTGQFHIAPLGGIVQVDGHFVNSGVGGAVIISGKGMELIGDLGGGKANFTNSATNATGLSIATNRYLAADTITNDSVSFITNLGRLEGRDAIINSGTIDSNAATSILMGSVTNHGTVNARGIVEGDLTNSASSTFNVTGNLSQTGNLTNAGTLAVTNGNLTGTDQLTNTSTITIANNRTVSATDIKNNTVGTITVGNHSILTGSTLENSATITVGSGGTVRSTSTNADDDLTNQSTGTISFNGTTGTANLSSGTGKIVNQGTINLNAGTVLVTGNLDGTGTVAIADEATFKTGSADQTIANAMTLAGTSTIDTNGFDTTVSGNMTSTGGLTKSGVGNLTLEGTNTFSGATSINAGQLTLKGGSALDDANDVAIGSAGKLKIETAETIGSLAGDAGSETTLSADLTTGSNDNSTDYSGKIVGTGKLTKAGTGTMSFSGANANTFSGGVDIDNGTVTAETNEQLGTGSVNVASDGKLQVDSGTTQTIAGLSIYSSTTVDPITSATTTANGTVDNSGTITSNNTIFNAGHLNNKLATSILNGGVQNDNEDSILDNNGTINGGVENFGLVENDTADSVINGGLTNSDGTTNNTGTINNGVLNELGTVNSDTATSVITGGLTNHADTNLRNQVSGAIVNANRTGSDPGSYTPTINVKGDLTGDDSLLNQDSAKLHVKDGNFTGITALTNQSTDAAGVQIDATRTLGAAAVTNQYGSTIDNSGALQSGSVIHNSGTITNHTGATVNGGINNADVGALVTNSGTINGGITQNFGTVNSLDANSIIAGGVNNSAYVNAQGQISGAVINNAQRSFTDVTLNHAQANAAGTVTFGSGASEQTFNLTANGGSAVGAEGNGQKNVSIVFDADPADVGTSSYDADNDVIWVYVADETSTTVQDIQTAINNGSGFTASGGTLAGTVESNGITDALAGGRDGGTALIRVLADATGWAAQNKQVAIINDNAITANTAEASVDSATGNIVVKVNGDVGYSQIAAAIDDLSDFNASVALSTGDQGYQSLDTLPPASTLTNGIFNVEGDLVADDTFTNGGQLNLNHGSLTGVTAFTNTGDVLVQDGLSLEATTVNNDSGKITLGHGSVLYASESLNNSAEMDVHGLGVIASDGAITNNASGQMTFGLGGAASNEVSELYSDNNTIVNNGRIDMTNGVLLTTGNVSGDGTIAMGNDTTFRTGNTNQTITNSMTVATGSATFDTNSKNATVSGAISGDGGLNKSGSGTLTLSGTNTFTGPATINGGQVDLQGGSAIADSTAVQLQTGSLIVSSAETIGSLATSAGTQTTLNASLTTGSNNSSTASAGLISGTAGLVKQGTGTMTLNGSAANTYAGGTTVSNGSLVAATNQQLGSGSVNVGTGANLTTGNSTTQSIAGLINQGTVSLGSSSTLNVGSSHFNNSGTFNVGSSANIIDDGAITNSGTINFAGGTATLSSATNSITNTGDINLNAGTVLVKGNVAGSGSINMNNGTTLRSGNANQQIANGIAVNSGTAVIDTNGNSVNLTGTITGAGTLNKVGAGNLTWVGVNNGNALVNSGVMITSTQSQVGNIHISDGSGVIFDQTMTGIYSGNVTGDGTLTKAGSGTVTMMGDSTYTGGTNVIAGTLRVGSNGTGQIQSNVNVGQTGTLGGGGTVTGNVTTQQGARLAAGNSIGTLNINGNLNAGGSVIENELNGTTSDLINVTGNANISGAQLQNVFDTTTSYTTRMYRALNATGDVTGRFSLVSNVNAPSNFLISTYYTPTTANVVLTSLADATLASSTSTSLLSSGQDYLTTIMNQLNGYQIGGLGLVTGDYLNHTHRNVWFKGVGSFSDMDADRALPGYSANTGGGIVGIDQVFGDSTRLGFAGGYTATDLTMGNLARAHADIHSARVNLYGAHSSEFLTLSGIGGYAHHDVDSERHLLGIGTALGKQVQNEASLNFQLTMNPLGETASLLPFVGIQWVHLAQAAYSEHGTPGFDMLFNKGNVDSLRPYVGLGYQYRIVTQSGLAATPYLFARYSRETNENSNLTSLSINGSNFVVAGIQPNQNIVGLGGGINSQLRQNLDWYSSYSIDLGDRGTSQNAAGGLGFRF